jgi:hypothetical protein
MTIAKTITILDTAHFDLGDGFNPATLEFGQVRQGCSAYPDRFYVRIVRGNMPYPHGVRNEAFSRSYMKGVWAETLNRYAYISQEA